MSVIYWAIIYKNCNHFI